VVKKRWDLLLYSQSIIKNIEPPPSPPYEGGATLFPNSYLELTYSGDRQNPVIDCPAGITMWSFSRPYLCSDPHFLFSNYFTGMGENSSDSFQTTTFLNFKTFKKLLIIIIYNFGFAKPTFNQFGRTLIGL